MLGPGALGLELLYPGSKIDDESGHLLALHLLAVEIADSHEEESGLLKLLLHQIDVIPGLHVEGEEVGGGVVGGVLLAQQNALVDQLALPLEVVVVVSQYAQGNDVLRLVLQREVLEHVRPVPAHLLQHVVEQGGLLVLSDQQVRFVYVFDFEGFGVAARRACVEEVADFQEVLQKTVEKGIPVQLFVEFHEDCQFIEEVGRSVLVLEFEEDGLDLFGQGVQLAGEVDEAVGQSPVLIRFQLGLRELHPLLRSRHHVLQPRQHLLADEIRVVHEEGLADHLEFFLSDLHLLEDDLNILSAVRFEQGLGL